MRGQTKAILSKLYPIVAKSMVSNTNNFRRQFTKFVNGRAKELFATAPLNRMPFGTQDAEEIFQSIKISRTEVKSAIAETYYWEIPAFNPRYAKDEVTILLLCITRYFLEKKDHKNAELAATYLGFTGKFYPSIHYAIFPKAEPAKYEHVMEYVINNLSNKYDIKREGHVIGTVTSISKSWMDTYEKRFKNFDDEDVTYLVQQLHNRIKSFIKNIASLYYKAYENKDYITFDSENQSDEDFHLSDSDSLKAERCIENAMSKLNTMAVNYRFCKMAADSLVRTDEIKSIIESVIGNKDNMADIKELVRLLVYTYFAASTTKEVSDIKFITFSVAAKPNSKDPHINRIKEIVESWLMTSDRYQRRKNRLATKNSYFKTVIMYFTLVIHTANK